MTSHQQTQIIILMGVSGTGKTTIGTQLAAKLGWQFYDGDNFHPPANIEKMSNSIPLTDDDRSAWLASLRQLIEKHLQANTPAIIACSALKADYRHRLKQADDAVLFVFLQGTFDLIWSRMQEREGHFMKAEMLKSQFDTLEPPSTEDALFVQIDKPISTIISQIIDHIR